MLDGNFVAACSRDSSTCTTTTHPPCARRRSKTGLVLLAVIYLTDVRLLDAPGKIRQGRVVLERHGAVRLSTPLYANPPLRFRAIGDSLARLTSRGKRVLPYPC